MIFVTFIGVSLITIGYKEDHSKDALQVPLLTYIGLFAMPILMSYGVILMRRMDGVHENSVALFTNTISFVVITTLCFAQGDTFPYNPGFGILDWIMMVTVSVINVTA